jgi:hypothetical protein
VTSALPPDFGPLKAIVDRMAATGQHEAAALLSAEIDRRLDVTAGRDIRPGRRRPRGYKAWNPRPQTLLLLEQVDCVLEEYSDFLPLTVRQIFYRLVGAHGYEKSELAYSRLAEALVRARRSRLIPFGWIRDDGVVTIANPYYESAESFWNAVGGQIKGYRRDRQHGQSFRIELWCEAAGMLAQLERIASRYSVPVYSAGGFASLSAVRQIVDRARERDQATVLLHVGDLDPSGESIFEAMTEDAQAFLSEDQIIGTQRIIPDRVALTAEQVVMYELETSPPKKSDGRSSGWAGGTCQLEALAPDVLAQLVELAILSWIDEDVLRRQVELEEQDRNELYRALPPPGGTT